MPSKIFKELRRMAFADAGSVKARVIRSGIWVGAASVCGSILDVVRSVALARLLSPEMFGLMGLAGIAIRAVETVTRPGVAQALIARQRPFEEAAATAFTLLALRGLLLALVLAALAPWVASFYEVEILESMIQVLAAVFVIGGLANINTIALQKELDFRRLTYLGLATTVLGTLVVVPLAYWLRSVWALVIGQIASAGLGTLLSYYFVAGRPRLAWNAEIARELFRYGKFITGSSLVLFIALELDSAVIGKMLGVEQLGFYALAFTVANLATTNLSKIASSIMMPAYSKLQDDKPALRRAYLRTLSLVMLVVLPATLGLILMADAIVVVVYGAKWLPAALPLKLLAIFGLVRSLAAFSGYLFEGIGLPKIAFQLGLLRLLVIVPLIVPATSQYGLIGAAVTVTAGIAVQWIAGLVFLNRHLDIGVSQIFVACWRSVWSTAVMSVTVAGLMQFLPTQTIFGFVTIVFGGVAVYSALNARLALRLREAGSA